MTIKFLLMTSFLPNLIPSGARLISLKISFERNQDSVLQISSQESRQLKRWTTSHFSTVFQAMDADRNENGSS